MRTDSQFLRVMCVHIGNAVDRARLLAIADALEGILTPNPDRFPKVYTGLKINQAARIKVDDSWVTREELNSLRLYLQGLTTEEVAMHLHKSPKTISSQLIKARARLNCSNYAQLAVKVGPVCAAYPQIEGRGRSSKQQTLGAHTVNTVAAAAPTRAL